MRIQFNLLHDRAIVHDLYGLLNKINMIS